MKPEVHEISDGIFRLTLPMPFRLNHVNIYGSSEFLVQQIKYN